MKLGYIQKLTIEKFTDHGVYLREAGNTTPGEHVLLPKKQVPEGSKIGTELEVFLYKDSKDRLIATVNVPLITMGGIAVLRVKEVAKIGAFLDWGLEKDLFLPFKEMTAKVNKDDEVLVRLYVDKSERLCASMKGLYSLLDKSGSYQKGDDVDARVYEFGHDYGTYVAIDDKYSAMIPKHEDVSHLRIGDVISVKITGIKPDGKYDVSLRDKAYIQMEADSAKVMDIIDSFAGVLPFSEKASSEVIYRETGLSKNAFKRAIGRLYKERLITLDNGVIRKVD